MSTAWRTEILRGLAQNAVLSYSSRNSEDLPLAQSELRPFQLQINQKKNHLCELMTGFFSLKARSYKQIQHSNLPDSLVERFQSSSD